jgi:hypothetical protein
VNGGNALAAIRASSGALLSTRCRFAPWCVRTTDSAAEWDRDGPPESVHHQRDGLERTETVVRLMECGTSCTFEDGITGFHHTAGTGMARIPRQPVRRALAHPVGDLGLHGAAASRLQRNEVDQILSRHWPLASPSPEQVVRHAAWTVHDLEVKPVMQLVGRFPESRSGADLPSETATWRASTRSASRNCRIVAAPPPSRTSLPCAHHPYYNHLLRSSCHLMDLGLLCCSPGQALCRCVRLSIRSVVQGPGGCLWRRAGHEIAIPGGFFIESL